MFHKGLPPAKLAIHGLFAERRGILNRTTRTKRILIRVHVLAIIWMLLIAVGSRCPGKGAVVAVVILISWLGVRLLRV